MAVNTYRVAEVHGEQVALRFGGAQWDVIHAQVKGLRQRSWDAERKAWLVSKHDAAPILERWEFRVVQARKGIVAPIPMPVIEERVTASRAIESQRSLPPSKSGLVPRHYQAAALDYILADEPRVLVGDAMGTGKTATSTMAAREANAFPLVVVCPMSVKDKWARELNDWLWKGVGVQVLRTGKDRVNPRADVLVVNYDLLRPAKEGKRYVRRLDGLAERIKAVRPAGLIVDEFHFAKSHLARRTKALTLLAQDVPFRLGLSGTPFINQPTDLAAQLAILGRLAEFGGWKWFNEYYDQLKGWSRTRATREMDQLNAWLRSTCYLRREKADVLTELPPKTVVEVPVVIDNWTEYRQAQHDTVEWLRGQGRDADRFAETAKVEYLRQVAVRGKMGAAFSWIDEFLASGEKLVVFAHHRVTVEEVARRYKAPMVYGDASAHQREQAMRSFQEGDAQVIVCNLRAGGVGVDLYAASNVLFLEFPWTPAELEQAEDRCHRQGQVNPVTAWHLVASDTIDETMLHILARKRAIVDPATRGLSVMQELIEEVRR